MGLGIRNTGINNPLSTLANVVAPPLSAAALRAQLATYFGADVDTVLAPYLKQLNGSQLQAPERRRRLLPHLPDSLNGTEASHTITAAEARALWINMSRDAGVTCPTLRLAREERPAEFEPRM